MNYRPDIDDDFQSLEQGHKSLKHANAILGSIVGGLLGGGGEGETSGNSSTTVTLPQAAQNVQTAGYEALGSLPTPEFFPGSGVVQYSPQTQAIMDLTMNRAINGSPVTNIANEEAMRTAGGAYLNNNAYLDSAWNYAADDIQNRITSQFGASGRSTSGAHAYQTADALMKGWNDMYMRNYGDERNRMMQAVGFAPNLASVDWNDMKMGAWAGNMFDRKRNEYLQDAMMRHAYNNNIPWQVVMQRINAANAARGGDSVATSEGSVDDGSGGFGAKDAIGLGLGLFAPGGLFS